MRILVFSDIHGSNTGLMTTLELCQRYEPNLVIVCGDITNFGPMEWGEGFLNRIPYQKAAVPGNCDPIELPEMFKRTGTINLHRRKKSIAGIEFAGAGGADYTPFNTPFEFEDDTFSTWLKPIMDKNMVLVTHAPAYGFLDQSRSGSHRGSHSLRKIVDEWKPILMLSGHMHEARGVEVQGDTVFVNPGPAKDGFGALVELTTPEELGQNSAEEIDWDQIRKSVDVRLLRL